MFKNQPKGLYVLALSNTGERFGYYTMLAILLLFLQAKFAFSTAWSSSCPCSAAEWPINGTSRRP